VLLSCFPIPASILSSFSFLSTVQRSQRRFNAHLRRDHPTGIFLKTSGMVFFNRSSSLPIYLSILLREYYINDGNSWWITLCNSTTQCAIANSDVCKAGQSWGTTTGSTLYFDSTYILLYPFRISPRHTNIRRFSAFFESLPPNS